MAKQGAREQTTNRKTLTPKAIEAYKPARDGKSYVVWDGAMPNMALRVGKESRSFVVVRRQAGTKKLVWLTLGRYPHLTLAEARDRARETLRHLSEGRNPVAVEAEAREKAAEQEAQGRQEKAEAEGNALGAALEVFFTEHRNAGLRSWSDTEGTLRRYFLGEHLTRGKDENGKPKSVWVDGPDPIWRAKPIAEIFRRVVVARLDAIKAERGKHAARHALSAIRKFFNWCAEGERFGIEVSPCANIRDKTIGIKARDLKRKRVLTDDELRDVWQGADEIGYPFGRIVQLLMLDGQRLNDIACARRPEINAAVDLLTVPAARYKTNASHEVPITPDAAQIFNELPQFTGSYLFSTTSGQRPFSGFAKAKARLDAIIAKRREAEGREAMPHWTLHDLRRTMRTRLGELGVDRFICERVIGHAMPGLDEVYDQGQHRTEKRDALAKWAAALMQIVKPKPPSGGKVVQLKTRKRA